MFIAGVYPEEGLVTDVFAFRGGSFQNVTLADEDRAVQTVRNYYVYATDIDTDGLIELPEFVPLPRQRDPMRTIPRSAGTTLIWTDAACQS